MDAWLQTSVDLDAEPAAWETLWRWRWFAADARPGFRAEAGPWCAALGSILPRFNLRSIHDAACGLGFKTVLLAEQGYELSGSDPCSYAVERARELAASAGHAIPFFASSFAELPNASPRRYDCVHSDHFDQTADRAGLERGARAVFAALADRGVFLFGAVADRTRDELELAIETEWGDKQRFVVFPPCTRGSTTLRELHVLDRLADGILENRLYCIEEDGKSRLETSFYRVRALWTVDDYAEVFARAGFRDCVTFSERGDGGRPLVFHAAIK